MCWKAQKRNSGYKSLFPANGEGVVKKYEVRAVAVDLNDFDEER